MLLTGSSILALGFAGTCCGLQGCLSTLSASRPGCHFPSHRSCTTLGDLAAAWGVACNDQRVTAAHPAHKLLCRPVADRGRVVSLTSARRFVLRQAAARRLSCSSGCLHHRNRHKGVLRQPGVPLTPHSIPCEADMPPQLSGQVASTVTASATQNLHTTAGDVQFYHAAQ